MAKISHVDQLLDRWILEWQNALREEKDEVVKKTNVSTKGFEDFAKQLGTDCPESVTNAIYAIEDLVEKGEAKWGTVVNTWYAFVGTNYYQIDHKEFSNISSRLRIIYEGFLDLQRFNATDNSYNLLEFAGNFISNSIFAILYVHKFIINIHIHVTFSRPI